MTVPEVCFYCKSSRIHIALCMDCRTKYEFAKQDYDSMKKSVERMTKGYWNVVNENGRLREALRLALEKKS